jgi:hypothetical protein
MPNLYKHQHTYTDQDVRTELSNLYNKNQAVQDIYDLLKENDQQGYVFGGAIRCLLSEKPIKDFDIVCVGDPTLYENFYNAMQPHFRYDSVPTLKSGLKKAFAGIKSALAGKVAQSSVGTATKSVFCKYKGFDFDIWHISEQRGFDTGAIHLIKDVPSTTFLTVESIVATLDTDPKKIVVHDDGFYETMRSETIQMRKSKLDKIDHHKYAVKSWYLKQMEGFELSPELENFTKNAILNMSVKTFTEIQREKYKKICLTLDDIDVYTVYPVQP